MLRRVAFAPVVGGWPIPERAEDEPPEPEENTEAPTPPDPHRDSGAALDALEDRVLGALPDPARNRHGGDEDEKDDEDEEPGPQVDEPPS